MTLMSEPITNNTTAVRQCSERYEQCEVCGGSIDSYDAGYFKSPDERFRHALCHENGEAPQEYVLKASEDETDCCVNHQYNCGHTVYLPMNKRPMVCPECTDIEVEL